MTKEYMFTIDELPDREFTDVCIKCNSNTNPRRDEFIICINPECPVRPTVENYFTERSRVSTPAMPNWYDPTD